MKCDVCKSVFFPRNSLCRVCSPDCAFALTVQNRLKAEKKAKTAERKADAVKRDKLKSKAQWAREAQTAVNQFIRLRDADQPCISCGRHHQGQYHAGHYLSVGARPELRFAELNVHKQCSPCNTHLSGNAVLYRAALINKIGLASVEWLEGPHEPRRYTIDDLKAIKRDYTAKVKELRAAHETAS